MDQDPSQEPKSDQPVKKLDPLGEKAFDGEKESVEIKSSKCPHQLEWLVAKGDDLECTHCYAGWPGLSRKFPNVRRL